MKVIPMILTTFLCLNESAKAQFEDSVIPQTSKDLFIVERAPDNKSFCYKGNRFEVCIVECADSLPAFYYSVAGSHSGTIQLKNTSITDPDVVLVADRASGVQAIVSYYDYLSSNLILELFVWKNNTFISQTEHPVNVGNGTASTPRGAVSISNEGESGFIIVWE